MWFYSQKWEKERINKRVLEAEQQARTSLRARVSLRPEQHVEDAVQQECGADAQRPRHGHAQRDAADRRLWEVLGRMNTLQEPELEQWKKRSW